MRHSQPTQQTTHSTNDNVDQSVRPQILEHPSFRLPWRASHTSESSDLQLLPPIRNTEYDLRLRTCFWWRCSCHRYPSHQDDQQVSGRQGNTAQGGSLELRGTSMRRMRQEVLIHSRNCFQVVCLSNSIRYKIKDKMTEEVTKNVGHLVLKVLCCNQGVQELSSPFNHSMNFATASSQMSIVIKGLLQVIDRLVPWFCSSINKDTDFRLRVKSEGVSGTWGRPIPSVYVQWHWRANDENWSSSDSWPSGQEWFEPGPDCWGHSRGEGQVEVWGQQRVG